MNEYITGIQQIGIGVKDAEKSMHIYKALLGMDVVIFNDVAEAKLMTQYTGGKVYERRAILTINMMGGGGFEIWQYLNRKPVQATFQVRYGDLGIFAAKMKCLDIDSAHKVLNDKATVSEITKDAAGSRSFWLTDQDGYIFQIVEAQDFFEQKTTATGGVCGAVIGVSDMEIAVAFYSTLLGTAEVVYDAKERFKGINEEQPANYHRVLLRKKGNKKGGFGSLLGGIELELVKALDYSNPKKIYSDRFWGDLGFVHLCLDVINMEGLKKQALDKGYNFTVDSNNSFEMDAAAGRFCYVEDPDGTLIELVETHKVPVMKKFGLYLNLKRRGLEKPLPRWMVKMLSISKVK